MEYTAEELEDYSGAKVGKENLSRFNSHREANQR